MHMENFAAMDPSQPVHVVRLDGIHCPAPALSSRFTYTEYSSTSSDKEIIVERCKDADVIITTRVPISEETLTRCPRIKHIAVLAVGTFLPSFP